MNSIINVDAISFSYSSNAPKILNNCSLQIKKGEVLTVLGPNGSGKSTLLNCICGLLTPQNGRVIISGRNIKDLSRREIANSIGYVCQSQHVTFEYTVFDYVLMGRASKIKLFGKPQNDDFNIAHDAIRIMSIEHIANSPVTEISGGELQLAAIARVIAQQPEVILFDEPTAHLDYGNQMRMIKLIATLRDKGFSVVMTTHTPEHCMMIGGKVAIIEKNGKVEIGKCEDIITEDKLKKIFEVDSKIVYIDAVHRKVCAAKFDDDLR